MKIFATEQQLITGLKQILSSEDKVSHTYRTTKNEVTIHISADMNNVRKEILNFLNQPGRIKE